MSPAGPGPVPAAAAGLRGLGRAVAGAAVVLAALGAAPGAAGTGAAAGAPASAVTPVYPVPGLAAALDSLAAGEGFALRDLRVDPASLALTPPAPGALPLAGYFLAEPLRAPGTFAHLARDLAAAPGAAPALNALYSLVLPGEPPPEPPTGTAGPGDPEAADGVAALLGALETLYAGSGKRFQGKDREDVEREAARLDPAVRRALGGMIRAAAAAAEVRDREVDRSGLERGGLFGGKSARTAESLRALIAEKSAPSPEEARAILAGVRSLDRGALFRGGLVLAGKIEAAADGLARGSGSGEPGSGSRMVWSTPRGRVAVGGPGDDVYRGSYLLVLDLGGNDVYEGPGQVDGTEAVSLVVDLGGDDRYAPADSAGLAPGAAVLGYAGVVDLGEGRDTAAGAGPGAGFAFLGVAWFDDRGGDDRYRVGGPGEGSAIHGLAVLADGGGDDDYRLARAGQGLGGEAGAGLLLDRSGNDAYRLADSTGAPSGPGQGVGAVFGPFAAGGLGLLVDGAGDDAYRGGVGIQGAGGARGLGALCDLEGNDDYGALAGAQGFGTGAGTGLLFDGAGNDVYRSGEERPGSLGCGEGLGVGIAVDAAGDDEYAPAGTALGVSRGQGMGWFVDGGGADTYGADPESGFARLEGGAVPRWRRGVPGVALFLDLGGGRRPRGWPPAAGAVPVRGSGTGRGGAWFGPEAPRPDGAPARPGAGAH